MSKYKNLPKEKLLEIVEQQDKELQDPKKYGLFWDKEKVVEDVVADCENNLPVLKRIKNREIKTNDNEDNILINGDNYHALNVLNYTHRNKIDVIYIDPPYNTGNKDFKYNDSFVDRENSYRHSMWLNFIEKRLIIGKKLLNDKGVIFISIDHNEFAQLKLLCDRIFGELNFVANYIWESRSGKGATAKYVVNQHEYVLCYAKKIDNLKLKYDIRESHNGNFEDIKGKYKREQLRQWGQGDKREDRPTMYYSVVSPDNTIVFPTKEDGSDGRWRIGEVSMKKLIDTGDVDFVSDGEKYNLYKKIRDGKITKTAFGTLLFGLGTASTGTIEIKNILGSKVFDTTKPINLIKYLLNLTDINNGIILDFMAGSGTTGHAVLDLNKEDGGNRKFILCTNNENKICEEVTYPRLEKAINGYKNLRKEKINGLGGNLKYFETDFVKNTNNRDQLKINLTKKCTEILCVKENIFNLKKDKENYKIFTSNDGNKHLCIYYNFINKDFDDFIKEVTKLSGKKSVYIFALNNKINKKEFKGIKDVSFEAIPYKILEIYEQLVKISKK
jgi:adenine-specific DNA-methyltransferase